MTFMPGRSPIPVAGSVRMTLRTVHEQIVSQTNSFHRDVRAFRNRLVIATLISAGAIAAVVFSQWRLPMAELLQMPKGTDGVARYAVLTLVMLFGAIGGLVASIPSLATTPRIASPFSFPIEQALLKVVVGSLTALVGV